MKSEFDRGYARGLGYAVAVARVTARCLYAKGPSTKYEAAADAISQLADGFAEAIHAPDPAVVKPAEIAAPVSAPSVVTAPAPADDRRRAALSQGYTGDICNECQNMTMVRNGTCLKCETCGSTTGCS